MRKLFLWVVQIVLLAAMLTNSAQAAGHVVLVMELEGALNRAMVLYLERGFDRAVQENAELIVLELNTPGGQIDLMQEMVALIRGSHIPVVVFVTPRGAVAGSAGTVITLAGHAAAMSPETAIGAASPISGSGEDLPDTLDSKIQEILKADVRTLAERRGPEAVALAESTIENATAATAGEAYEIGLIDFVAEDLGDLLKQMDGFEVQMIGETHRLDTQGLISVQVSMNFIEQLLSILANPLIVFSLLAIGFQAILIEISSPGGWVPGTVGVICVALGLYGLGVLSVNWFGLVFVVLAFVLLILEIKTPTFGALAIAGIGSLVIGGLILFNGPGTDGFQRVSVSGIVTVSVSSSAFFLFIVYKALEAQRGQPQTGAEAMIGQEVVVQRALKPSGTVLVQGEIWHAHSDQPVEKGETVEILAVKGLRLRVKRIE